MIWTKKKISKSKIHILPYYEQMDLKTAIVIYRAYSELHRYVVKMQYCQKRARQSIPAQQTNARRRVPT